MGSVKVEALRDIQLIFGVSCDAILNRLDELKILNRKHADFLFRTSAQGLFNMIEMVSEIVPTCESEQTKVSLYEKLRLAPCPHCGEWGLMVDVPFCMLCDLQPFRVCRSCGKECELSVNTCEHCGAETTLLRLIDTGSDPIVFYCEDDADFSFY